MFFMPLIEVNHDGPSGVGVLKIPEFKFTALFGERADEVMRFMEDNKMAIICINKHEYRSHSGDHSAIFVNLPPFFKTRRLDFYALRPENGGLRPGMSVIIFKTYRNFEIYMTGWRASVDEVISFMQAFTLWWLVNR